MRFWWVNQNQTWRHEVGGGYLWSPKRKRGGGINPFYEFMREVGPGDLVLSFADTLLRAYGIARSYAYEAPKPVEFGSAGRNWDEIGWRVDVVFHEIPKRVRPRDWIELLRPLLPAKYSPLLPDGRGSQSMYLTELSAALARALCDLVGGDVARLASAGAGVRVADPALAGDVLFVANREHVLWEEHLRVAIERDERLTETQKESLVLARRGQGRFRAGVQQIESRCRITHVDRAEHLRASHLKPWRDADNDERLDGENGLLLTPSIDHLLDRGFLSFRDDGRLLVSPVAHRPSLARMGVPVDRDIDVGTFTPGQERYLEYHRDAVFLKARTRPA